MQSPNISSNEIVYTSMEKRKVFGSNKYEESKRSANNCLTE